MEQMLIVSNIILWCAVIVLTVFVFALARQVGVLYERVAPAGALALNRVLEVGSEAPALALQTLAGGRISVGGRRENGRCQLLFFLAPDCPVCKQLLAPLKSAARAEADWLELVLASDGDGAARHRRFVDGAGLNDFAYIISAALGKRYGVSKLPYAVLIDEQGLIAALGIVNSREHLESLFEARERAVASIQDYYRVQVENKP